MTKYDQNVTDYTAGDTLFLDIPVVDSDADTNVVTGGTVVWGLARDEGRDPVVTKSSAGTDPDVSISTDGSVVTVHIRPTDTEELSGDWFHEAELTDADEHVTTLIKGDFEIDPNTV